MTQEEPLASDDVVQVDPTGETTSPVASSIGQSLRQAREARGLSVDDVADVLRFSVRQIDAVEADNFSALPGATLVRGFIRGYAKLLRIDAQTLLLQLDSAVPSETSDIRPPTRIDDANEASALNSQLPRILLLVLVAGALVLAGLYFFVLDDQKQVLARNEPLPPPATVAPVPPASPAELAVPATSEAIQASPVADAAASAPGTTGGQTASEAVMPVVEQGLLIDFDDLSWVEVRDATNTVVLVGEYPKGTHRAVEGKAPFTIWIGRASVVRVTHRGQPVALKSSTREDVARLTLD